MNLPLQLIISSVILISMKAGFIKRLTIRNYGIIDELNLEFSPGLNLLTGETGAGKSLIIGALEFVLGERKPKEVIKTGRDFSEVRVEFSQLEGIELEPFGIPGKETVIISRRIAHTGRGGTSINGSPTTLDTVSSVGEALIDIHGQHEHQSLLKTRHQQELFDRYVGIKEQVDEFSSLLNDIRQKEVTLKALKQKEEENKRLRELKEFQLNELTDADIKEGELEEIQNNISGMENIERISSLLEELRSIIDSIPSNRILQASEKLTRLDRRFQEIASLSNELTTVSGELARSLREAALSIEFNQEKLDEMRLRLSFLQRLMEKYKTDYRGLLELRENLSRFEDELFFNEEKIDKLEREIKEEKRLLAELGEKLHTSRVAAKSGFEEKIEKNLSLLGMENADFLIEIEQEKEPTPFGFDRLEFFIRTNPGELPKPFRAVASGGEISRIMLACKSVISSVDNIPVMVFDEIDVGIGGRTANRVASMLKKISGEHQLIVVTHLPQIARMEGNHIRIEKITDGKRTNVVVKTLNKQEKEKELKRMLGVE